MTRDEILNSIKQTHADLVSALDGIPEDVMTTRPVIDCDASSQSKEGLDAEESSLCDDAPWTLKDVLGHVTMWRRVAVQFIDEYQRDGAPAPLGLEDAAAIDAYNQRGAALRRDDALARVRAEFDASLRDLVAAVEKLSDAELTKPLPTPWDAGVTLEYLIAINSYGHEPEHVEQIKRWRKERATQH